MNIVRRFYPLVSVVLCIFALINLVLAPCGSGAASQRTLAWNVVDTPSDGLNGMVIRPLGINSFALGKDNRTFWAADTANSAFYKSTDAGYSWMAKTNLPLPVWNVVMAPGDETFIAAVTDGGVLSPGPKMVYFSTDGGGTWETSPFPAPGLDAGEFISTIDISRDYSASGNARDIAIGTRGTNGRVFNIQYSTSSAGQWKEQSGLSEQVMALKFSPTYDQEEPVIVALSCTAASTRLNFGLHDTTLNNSTSWNPAEYVGYPITISTLGSIDIIVADLELPSDFRPSVLTRRVCYASIQAASITQSMAFRINSNASSTVVPIMWLTQTKWGVSSIAYRGASASGMLLAGAATADLSLGHVNVWVSGAPLANDAPSADWLPLEYTLKLPTGGGNTGRANALLAWSADGATAYCGTSADSATAGGTGTGPLDLTRWPFSRRPPAPVLLDESAFSYSPDNGLSWNQIGLINTRISQLSDVAAHEQADDPGTLYLASLNTDVPGTTGFDSVWRSTSDPLGQAWERILTWPTSDTGAILRINPADADSRALVVADLGTVTINYSSNAGETWAAVLAGMNVNDLALADDKTMFILDDFSVRKASGSGSNWKMGNKVNLELLAPGHTICIPTDSESMVFVGTEGDSNTQVAWADFAELFPKFTPLKELPMQGNVHVATDDLYDGYKNVYAAIGGIGDTNNSGGTIYRWTMEGSSERGSLQASTNWDPLEPPDIGFYGICMLSSVLYGAWNTDITAPIYSTGADRTLEARIKVPPPPQWDQLIDGLPAADDPNKVEFTREPSSLHISSNAYNTLWAIDDRLYTFDNSTGCLWQFVDSVAKLGPWPTSPPPGGLIGPDPSTGRSQQIDFSWRPLRDIFGYDVLIAKDVDFTLPLSQVLNLTPVDDLTGAWVVTTADQEDPSCWISPGVLEVGRSYYWRVRASRSIRDTPIHSPWSPTLFFSVKPGFRVTADYMGPTLLAPVDGICGNCKPPIRFSWSPVKNTTSYEFILAKNAQLTDIVVQEKTKSTAFEVKSKLQPATPYYWQVRAVAPIPGDPSPVGTFTLTAENKTAAKKPPATAAKPGGVAAPGDFWIWIIIVIVVVLLLLINAYVFVSRRRDSW